MVLFYDATTLAMKLALLMLARWRVYGVEHVPRRGPLIVAANHLSLADPPLLSASIPRRIVFMAKDEAYRSLFLGPLVRGFGAFPVRRGEADRAALRRALSVLEAGGVLGIFPEGTRSRNRQLQPGRSGVARIALRSGAPILPVGIAGTEHIGGPGILLRPAITVRIGQPFHLPGEGGRIEGNKLAEYTAMIMDRIAELLPEEYLPKAGCVVEMTRGMQGQRGI